MCSLYNSIQDIEGKRFGFFFYNYTHRWFLARIYIRGNIAALILCLIAYLNMPRKYVQWPTISQYLFYNWLRYARFRVYLDIFFFIPSHIFYDWIAFLIKELTVLLIIVRNYFLSHKNKFYSWWRYSITKSKPSSIIHWSFISKRQIYLTLQNNQKESGSACLIMKKVGYYIFSL